MRLALLLFVLLQCYCIWAVIQPANIEDPYGGGSKGGGMMGGGKMGGGKMGGKMGSGKTGGKMGGKAAHGSTGTHAPKSVEPTKQAPPAPPAHAKAGGGGGAAGGGRYSHSERRGGGRGGGGGDSVDVDGNNDGDDNGGGDGGGGVPSVPVRSGSPSSCPDYMVFVPGVVNPNTKATYDACVDQYEAYVVKINSDGSESPWPFNSVPTAGVTLAARVAPDVKPQAYMSGDASKAACVTAGKRLCRLEEWLAACQGPNKYTFPYGNTLQAGRCNIGRKTNPVMDVFGSKAKFDSVQMNDPRLDLLPNSVANTGAFSQCVSDYEAYDMHGNLDEWVDHINQPSGHGSFSGGFFVDGSINGPGCLYRTTAHVTSWHDYSLGFRCCQDAN